MERKNQVDRGYTRCVLLFSNKHSSSSVKGNKHFWWWKFTWLVAAFPPVKFRMQIIKKRKLPWFEDIDEVVVVGDEVLLPDATIVVIKVEAKMSIWLKIILFNWTNIMIELNEPQERKQFINSNEIGIRNEVLLVEVRLLLVMLTSLPVIKLLNCSLEREMEFLFLLCLSLSLFSFFT